MKTAVSLFGPNLSSVAQRKGEFHVHAVDCADCAHYGYGRRHGGEEEQGVSTRLEVSSQVEVAEDVYADIINGNDGATGETYVGSIYFAPCVKLPRFAGE